MFVIWVTFLPAEYFFEILHIKLSIRRLQVFQKMINIIGIALIFYLHRNFTHKVSIILSHIIKIICSFYLDSCHRKHLCLVLYIVKQLTEAMFTVQRVLMFTKPLDKHHTMHYKRNRSTTGFKLIGFGFTCYTTHGYLE